MSVYIIAVVIALSGAILYDRMTPTIKNILLIILWIYIVLVLGFRYKVGVDTLNYMKTFSHIPTLDHYFTIKALTSTRYEPGFLFVCSLCRTFTREFWTVQLIMAAITNGCIFIFLKRYCKNVFVGVLFYFLIECLYFTTEIMRESAAVAIFLLNYKNLEENKWVKYYLWSILSILFHYSAIIILIFPFTKWIKPNLLFFVLCVSCFFIMPIMEWMTEFITFKSIAVRLVQYVSTAEDLNLNWRIGELIRTAVPSIAVLIMYRLYKAKINYENMLLLQVLFSLGAFAVPLIFSRFSNYTIMFIIVGVSNLLSLKSIQLWIKVLFVSFILVTQSYSLYVNYQRWIPYSSIFNPKDYPFRNNIYRHSFMPWLRYTR